MLVLGDVHGAARRRARGGAHSGGSRAAVLGEGQRGVSGRQHRHRALSAGWRGTCSPAARGGQRSVRRQAPGKRRIQLSDPEIGQDASRRLAIETELHHALERDELSVHYQPQFDLAYRPHRRLGGAGALEQSEVRTCPSVGSDSHRRGERADRAHRRPRAAGCLPPGQVVAGRRLWAASRWPSIPQPCNSRAAIWPRPWRPRWPRPA
jgi:hypothetical protein